MPAPALAETLTPDIKTTSDFPTVDSIKKPETPETGAQPPITVAIPDATPAPASLTAATDTKTEPATSNDTALKISELEKNLFDKENELASEKQKTESATQEISNLKEKMAELEVQLKSAQTPMSKPAKAAKTENAVTEEHAQPKTSAPAHLSANKSKTDTVSKKSNWILKSAKPGHAVIADQKTGDYKTISIGDKISGLGRITLISETPSGWIVKGTQGSITE